jgi:hypothetical protein
VALHVALAPGSCILGTLILASDLSMQTTRLHISGLTPSISASDLKQRFSTFGEVQDVDGVGELDGIGEPSLTILSLIYLFI